MKGVALLLLVAMTHYGYPDDAASWWFYILRGVEGTILFLLLARHVNKGVAVLACWWGAFEEAQTAVCGYTRMGMYPNGDGLCIEAFGPLPYAMMAAGLIVYLWRQRDRKN